MKIKLIPQLKNSILLTAAIILLSLSSGCGGKTTLQASADTTPTTVVVAEVTQTTVPIYSEFVGQTRAVETVELRARVEGVLEQIYFTEGSPVKKGALLFSIDKRPFEAALQTAKAVVQKAESDLAQARTRTDVVQAQAALADAQAVHSKTEQDLRRLQPLAKENAVTGLELDAAIAAEKSAQASVDARQANVTNLEASVKYTIERAGAEVSAAKARVIQAELDLSFCDIYSPISGIIGFKNVDKGNLVGRGDATLLATVSTSDPLLVDFNLGEIDYLKLTDPATAGKGTGRLQFQLILSDDSVHPSPGTFKVIDRTVNSQTGTMKVEAIFPNPGSYLKPGQFARLRVAAAERENAILVPQRAIQDLQGAKTVLVVGEGNKVALRTIKIGDSSEKNYVVLEGLKAGERVIVEGIQKVRPGGVVNPTTASSTSESATKTEGK